MSLSYSRVIPATSKLLLASLLGASAWFWAGSASAQTYISRPLTLPAGTIRLDLAPPDYGYMDHGAINTGRGFRVADGPGDNFVGIGAGMGFGITSHFEMGGLILPLQLSPDGDVGDLEAYARFRFSPVVAFQASVQIPTQTEAGLSLGVPLFIPLSGRSRMETGIEVEFIFYDDTIANLDVPMAFQFAVGDRFFIGPRTGLLLADFDVAFINLGLQGGATVARNVDLTAGFNFPYLIQIGGGGGPDPDDDDDFRVSADGWEFVAGVNIFF